MTTSVLPLGTGELEWDLSHAVDVATRAVADGVLPCLAFGVVDGDGRSEIVTLAPPPLEVHDDSVFFIASVTKAVVATAVMQYVDEGRLDLHVPMRRYVPDFAGDGREAVTAWHLLTHTSGLPDMPVEQMRSERPTYRRVLRETLASRPRWEPGSCYEYNSSAWCLLSEAMARLSSSAWPAVLEDRLLRPLGMADTTFDARGLRRRIVPVDGVGAGNRLVAEVLLWFLARVSLPGGGLFGTAPDLLRLGQALLDGSLLSGAAITDMARQQIAGVPHIAEDGSVSYVEHGLGWRKSGGGWPPGEAVMTHGGRSGSRLWVDPERGFAFVFLTNVWGASSEVAIGVLDQVYRAHPD